MPHRDFEHYLQRASISESAITVTDFSPFDDELSTEQQSFSKILVVELASQLDRNGLQRVAGEIREALANAGSMYVKNHGVASKSVTFAWNKASTIQASTFGPTRALVRY